MTPVLEGLTPARGLRLARLGLVLLQAQVHLAGRTGQEGAIVIEQNIDQPHAIVSQQEFANLVGMRHASCLADIEAARPLAGQFEVAQQEPDIHQRGDADRGRFGHGIAGRQGVEQRGDAARLEQVDQADQHQLDRFIIRRRAERTDRIHDDDVRLEFIDQGQNGGKVGFQPGRRRTRSMEAQPVSAAPLRQLEADRGHVALDLVRRFLKRDIQATLAAPAGGVDQVGGDAALASAGGAGHEDAAAAEDATDEHGIEAGDAGRDALAADGIGQPGRGDRHHREAVAVKDERAFVAVVGRAAILDDAQAARGDLVINAVVEGDDTIGDIFLEPMAGDGVLAAFGGDDGGDAFVLEPVQQAAEFAAQDAQVGEGGEQVFDGIEGDAARTDGVDGRAQAQKDALQVEFSGLDQLAGVKVQMQDAQAVFLLESRQVEAE